MMSIIVSKPGIRRPIVIKTSPRMIHLTLGSVDIWFMKRFRLDFQVYPAIPRPLACHSERSEESKIIARKPVHDFRFLASLEMTGKWRNVNTA